MGLAADLSASRAPGAGFAAMGLVWGGFAALVPQIKVGIGASDAAFGTALFLSASMLPVAMWLAPRIEARIGALAMPLAALSMCAVFACLGAVNDVVGLAIVLGLAALTSGSLDVLMNARISAVESATDRSLMNLNHALFSLAYACAALASGAGREAELSAFAILAAVALVAALLSVMAFRDPVTPSPRSTLDGEAAGGSVVLWGGLIVLAGFLGEHASETWSALHLERTLGAGAAGGALGPALLGATMFAGRMSGQLAAQRLRGRTLLMISAAIAGTGAAVAAAAPTLGVAYAGFALLGLGVSVMAPTALGVVGRRVPPARRTSAIAGASMIGFMGFFVGPVAMGVVAEWTSLRVSFLMVAAAMLLVPLALARLRMAV